MNVEFRYPFPVPACCDAAKTTEFDLCWCSDEDRLDSEKPRRWHLIRQIGCGPDDPFRYEPVSYCPFCGVPLGEPDIEVQRRSRVVSGVPIADWDVFAEFEEVACRYGFEQGTGRDAERDSEFLLRVVSRIGLPGLEELEAVVRRHRRPVPIRDRAPFHGER